jgi:hypothetical protein
MSGLPEKNMKENKDSKNRLRILVRALIEMAFILFLFYANLLMGEFSRSGGGMKWGLLWALIDIFTWQNFLIAFITSLMGYGVFEFLRNQFES